MLWLSMEYAPGPGVREVEQLADSNGCEVAIRSVEDTKGDDSPVAASTLASYAPGPGLPGMLLMCSMEQGFGQSIRSDAEAWKLMDDALRPITVCIALCASSRL
mmetsp:Transcript_58504/g.165276  ORF Transcript_58504/g.165276 Transcript_58504/m.165276 type:complete len:104 (-) Transcript_58504:615-926(-)